MPPKRPGWVLTLLDLYPAYDILQDLVQGVADVQLPIRIRRAIVQHEGLLGSSFPRLPGVQVVAGSFYVLGLVC